jgi:hypothetical protein
VLELQATNQDLLLWDKTRAKHRWPKFEDAPFIWMTFLAWSAARRTGVIPPETKYEAWEADVLEITSEDNEEGGNPTLKAHEAE